MPEVFILGLTTSIAAAFPCLSRPSLEKGGSAEVWLYRYSSDHLQTYQELLSEYRGYRQLQPFADRTVYGCNVEKTLFYEESPFRPDWLLSDFIQILHPDKKPQSPLRYYQKLNE